MKILSYFKVFSYNSFWWYLTCNIYCLILYWIYHEKAKEDKVGKYKEALYGI